MFRPPENRKGTLKRTRHVNGGCGKTQNTMYDFYMQDTLKRCLDKTVRAVIVDVETGLRFTGTNAVLHQPKECPRKSLRINQGYHLCQTVCGQPAHAEVIAWRKWYDALIAGTFQRQRQAICYLYGAKRCCADCQRLLDRWNIEVRICTMPI